MQKNGIFLSEKSKLLILNIVIWMRPEFDVSIIE